MNDEISTHNFLLSNTIFVSFINNNKCHNRRIDWYIGDCATTKLNVKVMFNRD